MEVMVKYGQELWGLVAVKKILIGSPSPEMLQKVEKEIDILASLHHPNVLQIFGACVYSETEFWIVMELADGGSLYSQLAAQKNIPWDTRWKWIKEVATAVAFLHMRGVVHRDLKSPNFLLVNNTIKVCDFGMATTLAVTSKSRMSGSISASVCGTTRWLAPESTDMEPIFDMKTDIYGMGMVIWEIVSRELPFKNVLNDFQVIYLVKHEQQRPVLPPDCPKKIQQVIQWCWQHDPLARPTAEFVEVFFQKAETMDLEQDATILVRKRLQRRSKPREYFDIDYTELVELVGAEQIKIFYNPPVFPCENKPTEIPDKIEIVTLLPPTDYEYNGLVAPKYNISLYNHIADYFKQCFILPSLEYMVHIDKIEVIYNHYQEEKFRKVNKLFTDNCQSVQEANLNTQDNLQQAYFKHLCKSDSLLPKHDANPFRAWYATSLEDVEHISWYGLHGKGSSGFFGKGIYLQQAHNLNEQLLVSQNNTGSSVLILCWALLGNPNVVTKVSIDMQLKEYSSNYTVVTRKAADTSFFANEQDYALLAETTNYFPATLEDLTKKSLLSDEIVLFDSDQVLPRFIVHYHTDASRAHKPVRGREYFEINYAELVGVIPKGQITVLDKPPQYPIPDAPMPPIPAKIEIVTIYAPPTEKVGAQFLVSEQYDHRIFNRVAVYFHSFYVPSDPALEARVDRIEVILNSYVEQKFAKMNDLFESKYKGLLEFRPADQNEQQLLYLESLLTSKNLVSAEKMANPIAAWHGTSKDPTRIESICWYGLLDLSSADPGYYGKGIYLTQMPRYGEYYAQNLAHKKEGSFSLLLCWALLGKPYAVTKICLGAKPTPEHSSHYAVVSKKKADRKFFSKGEDYKLLEGITTYFPLDENERGSEMGDEIVLFDADQVIPRYIVHYTVGKKGKLPAAPTGEVSKKN